MITWFGLFFGFALGWFRAARRGGRRADKWQYALAHAIMFALLAFVISLIALRFDLLPASPVD